MSIGGQNALPRGWRLAATSIAEKVRTVSGVARTAVCWWELHTTLAGRISIKNFDPLHFQLCGIVPEPRPGKLACAFPVGGRQTSGAGCPGRLRHRQSGDAPQKNVCRDAGGWQKASGWVTIRK
jgi:hypothetical protein